MFTHRRNKFLFASALSLAAMGVTAFKPACAAPVLPTLPTNPPANTPLPPNPATAAVNTSSRPPRVPRAKAKAPRLLNTLTLDYANATPNSAEVLNAKVSVTLKDASFLSALDALMNASDKACRIECRQLKPCRLPLNVKDVPLAGMLDALAKLSGGSLYVLPSKLILAPATALTEDEKKQAKLYGVLLTAATLPNTPEAKALLTPKAKGQTILDIANTKVGAKGSIYLGAILSGLTFPRIIAFGEFSPKILAPLTQEQRETVISVDFNDVNYADVLASYAHSVGCELYLTPEHFLICAPDHLNDPENRQWTQNAVPAFNPTSTSITFPESSLKAS